MCNLLNRLYRFCKNLVLSLFSKNFPRYAKMNNTDFNDIREECLKNGTLYEDPDFPADDSSINISITDLKGDIKWIRPTTLVENPKFFVDGFSRFDVVQGTLQNCWFLAAIANLTTNPKLFRRVVPDEQSFEYNYAGIFYFKFWQYGEWVEVCVDDRLPTEGDGELLFMNSPESNEFWSALVEKAYAKLNGSYGALDIGTTSEAMVDLTGGITETIHLKITDPLEFYDILKKGFEMKSNIAASKVTSCNELVDENLVGLVVGHSYSITKLTEINGTKLLRIRNPWGTFEWNGAWSDQSDEWEHISDEIKEEIGLKLDDDGESWMQLEDFIKHFDFIDLCYLCDSISNKKIWEISEIHGEWISGCSAGGSRIFTETFWLNSQYFFTLENPSDDGECNECTVIIGLMQKNRRSENARFLSIGFSIYKISEEDRNSEFINSEFYNTRSMFVETNEYMSTREVCKRYAFPPGCYVIIPTTFEKDEESKFMLRIFCDSKFHMEMEHKMQEE